MKIIKVPEGRNDLAKLFTGCGAEVGTEKGKYAEIIAKYAEWLYCVDPWRHSESYRNHVDQELLDSFYELVKTKFKDKNVTVLRNYSVDAAEKFKDGELQFAYIDAEHTFEAVASDIALWYPKIKIGGILGGHDFVNKTGFGVKAAVQEFCEKYDYDLTIWTGDNSPSWSIVKKDKSFSLKGPEHYKIVDKFREAIQSMPPRHSLLTHS